MKKLISTLIAAAMLTAGAGVFAENEEKNPTGIHIIDPETGEYELTYDDNSGITEGDVGTVYEPAKEYLEEHADDVINTEKNLQESIDDLVAEEILQGFPDGDYHVEENVTRAQMAVFMTRLIYGTNYSKKHTREEMVRIYIGYAEGADIPQDILDQYAPYYSDLPEDHWAFTELTSLSTLHNPIMVGYGDGTIRPDNSITYLEAATMLIKGLHYDDLDDHGGYPDGTLYWAEQLNLFGRTGGENDVNAAATRGDIIIMISTALDTPYVSHIDENCVRTEDWHISPLTWRQDRIVDRVGEYDPFFIVPTHIPPQE